MPPLRLPKQSYTSRGILATALLSGLVLVGATYSSYRDAEALADIVNDGQVESYVRTIARRLNGPPTTKDLEGIVAEYQSQGVLGAAMIDPQGHYLRQAGTLTPWPAGKPRPRGRALVIVRAGVRYQVLVPPHLGPMPPPRNGDRPPPRGHEGPPENAPFPPPQGIEMPEVLMLEFEPHLAAALVRRAKTLFLLSTTVALLLATVALVLFRRGTREEALTKKLLQSERLASLGTMSAVLAHEIKNPLAALKGNAQLVAESLTEGSKGRAQADRVVKAAQRLQDLTQNLLDFARGGTVERSLTDPAELLFLAAEDAAPSATLELDEAPPLWSLDQIRMRQVLENLLRNAAQAKPENQITASVSVSPDGDELLYVIRDEGPGFPEEVMQSAFEPFFTTKTRGVGLGLAVSNRVVLMHGGTIHLANRKEGGAEVRIRIPKQGLQESAEEGA